MNERKELSKVEKKTRYLSFYFHIVEHKADKSFVEQLCNI
jgi:hypothetical protein